MDADKDLVTIKGTMGVKELAPYLQEKLKRSVEVMLPKKDDAGKEKTAGGGGDKKGKEPAVAEKKGDSGGKAKAEDPEKEAASPSKMEISRMEYHGYSTLPPPPMYWHNGPMYVEPPYGHHAAVPYQYHEGQPSQGHYPPVHYVGSGYSMDPRATNMFNDEDPNAACSIM